MKETVKIRKKAKPAVQEYQCPGCMIGHDTSCFQKSTSGFGCGTHFAGTTVLTIGKIFLGMPTGFNRLKHFTQMKPYIFESFEQGNAEWGYDMWNIPVWKYVNEHGHTLVRGISPRINEPFIHIYLENCADKIDCLEITKEQIEAMD